MHRNRGNEIRCVLAGDAQVGKTSLIVAYTTNGFSDTYIPTAFDNYSVTVNVDKNPLKLNLCDTAGRSEFDTIRPLSYADANVFLLCFSVFRPDSLKAITERWLPELKVVSPHIPVILVGTQSDKRLNYVNRSGYSNEKPIDPRLVTQIANQFNVEYIECSAITHHNLKEVFDLAILYGLNRKSITNLNNNNKSPKTPPKWLISGSNTEKNPEKPGKTPPMAFKESFRKLVSMTKRFI